MGEGGWEEGHFEPLSLISQEKIFENQYIFIQLLNKLF